MASITLENLNKTYPNGFVSVKNLSLHIEDGEFVICLLYSSEHAE